MSDQQHQQQQQQQQAQLSGSSNSQDQQLFDFISPIRSPSVSFQPQQQQNLFTPMVQQSHTSSINYGQYIPVSRIE